VIFDLLVVIVILAGAALGVWKGFAWQLAAIVSLLAGWAVAIPLSKPLAPLFGSTAPFNRFVALAVAYFLVSLGVYVLALVHRKTIEACQMKEWDKHLGGVFGAIKGYLFALMLVFFSITLSGSLRDPVLKTRTGWLMARTMDVLHPVWPPELHDILHPYIHHINKPAEPRKVSDPPPLGPGTSPAPPGTHTHDH